MMDKPTSRPGPDSDAVGQSLDAAADVLAQALAALPDADTPGLPLVAPVEMVAVAGAGRVDLTWWLDSGRTPVAVSFGRDGVDADGRGPWRDDGGLGTTGYLFDGLVDGVGYTFWVEVAWADGGRDRVYVHAVPGADSSGRT